MFVLVGLLGLASPVGAVELRLTDDARTSSATQADQDRNFGTNANLRVSSTAKSYIKFDFSTLPSGTVGSDVAKATLKLWADSLTMAGSVDVRRITAGWIEETITWNNAPPLGPVDGAGTVGEVFSFIVVDVTQLVKNWLDGTQANHGLALETLGSTDVTFDSKEDPQRGHEPQLEIVLATGTVDGGGTVNTVPKFTTATTLGNSAIVDVGGKVGIGTTNPDSSRNLTIGNGGTESYVAGITINTGSGLTTRGEIFFQRNGATDGYIGIGSQLFDSCASGNCMGMSAASGRKLYLAIGGAPGLTLDANYNVGIGTTSPTSRLHVVGDITATGAKNFQIAHPVEPERKLLVHSALEGPEAAVFYRGEAQLVNGEIVVTLPPYFEALARKEHRTVQLTPIGGFAPLYVVDEVQEGRFTVRTDGGSRSQRFYWEVKAVRADIPALVVEKLKGNE
ncbi:MAG: DNRLRE domain-containing protein [Candidatus Rokubacteria bacterium]|nr:DNRLRE domain-containing protein [Candidatus Rokubacteria bacterium]